MKKAVTLRSTGGPKETFGVGGRTNGVPSRRLVLSQASYQILIFKGWLMFGPEDETRVHGAKSAARRSLKREGSVRRGKGGRVVFFRYKVSRFSCMAGRMDILL